MKSLLAACLFVLGGCATLGRGEPYSAANDPTAPPPAFRYEMCPPDPLGQWTTWPCPFSSYGPQKEISR